MEVTIIVFSCRTQTKNKWSFFAKERKKLTEKFTPFLSKIKTRKKNVEIICCENASKNKTLEENRLKIRRN